MMRTSTLGVESLTQEQYEVFGDCENIWRHNIFWSLMVLECKLFTLPNSYVAESEIMDMVRQYGSQMCIRDRPYSAVSSLGMVSISKTPS